MANEKYQNKYRIPSNRWQGYDYGSNGCYFVTICTKNRFHYFGEIVENVETRFIASQQCMQIDNIEMRLIASPQGIIAKKIWFEIPNQFTFVLLDEFVIMPNHIHGILVFSKNDEIMEDTSKKGGITRGRNPMLYQELGRVIRWYKGRVSFECRSFGDFGWQERFYDRVIRNNHELENERVYIYNNQQKWKDDELYT